MPYSLLALIAFLAAGIMALRIAQLSRFRRLSAERIGLHTLDVSGGPLTLDETVLIASYPPRYYFAGPLAALLTGGLIFMLTKLPVPYPVAFSILAGVFVLLLEVYWRDSRIEKIENQLVDAVDLMVASLRAGSALLGALEAVSRQSRSPIRREFENMLGRIQLGEDPQAVVRELPLRVPLESFRLFAYSLLVQWETGRQSRVVAENGGQNRQRPARSLPPNPFAGGRVAVFRGCRNVHCLCGHCFDVRQQSGTDHQTRVQPDRFLRGGRRHYFAGGGDVLDLAYEPHSFLNL